MEAGKNPASNEFVNKQLNSDFLVAHSSALSQESKLNPQLERGWGAAATYSLSDAASPSPTECTIHDFI
jgi:hypothetical protein